MRNVQIPEILFLTLYQYHVLDRKALCDEQWIRDELSEKFEAWKRRVDYGADIERRNKSQHVMPDSNV